jgi:hypothetical protein
MTSFNITGVTNTATGLLSGSYVPMPSELRYSAGHYTEQVMPLEIIRPAPPTAVIGFYSPDYYGYVGRETQIRITVQGGRYPYNAVIDSAPSGATISNDASDKANYLVLKFTPTENGTEQIKVRLYDATGAEMRTIRQTFVTSTDWCVFAEPTGNDSTGDGSFANPYKTPQGARAVTTGGKALILKNGTYTDTTLGITLNSSTINSVLAWESRQAIIDMSANVQSTPSVLFYINSSHMLAQGIVVRNPQNQVASPRIFSGDSATNYVYQDDCKFEINGRSGTDNGDNVSCFFLGATGREFVAQTRCEFTGFVGIANGWSSFDFYGTDKFSVECNTVFDQASANSSGAGMLWVKGTGNRNGDIKNNSFPTVHAGSLIDVYMANVSAEDDFTGNIDVSFNYIKAVGNAGIWVARADQAGARLPVWCRRNTIVDGCILIFQRSYGVTFSSDSDVIQTSLSSNDPWKVLLRNSGDAPNIYRPLSDMGSLTASVTNYECQANSGVVDSNGVLTGSYATYRGTRGHEIVRT